MPLPHPQRLASIDQLRGTVMVLMLLDHVRETFYLHQQVSDPMDLAHTSPALFACRLLAHLCAPVFVFLTGLSAWLYGQGKGRAATAAFLAKRGAFLVLLELTLVNFAWTWQWPPQTLYLQVIWAIGLAMLALAALLWLPRALLVAIAAGIVAGHNLLDGLRLGPDSPWHPLWAVLHQRDWLEPFAGLRLRTSYPLLPWIGVIALGYAAGPWYGRERSEEERQYRLLGAGLAALAGFALLRLANVYGDTPWQRMDDGLHTAMSVFNLTKYPPSLQFVLLTLGVGLVLLRLYEWRPVAHMLAPLAAIGAAPMFFYLLHLYLLKLLQLAAVATWGPNQGLAYGVAGVGTLLAIAAALALALYWPTRAFARLKARRRDLAWLRYF